MISAPLRQIFHTRQAGHNPIRQAHTPPPVIPTKAAVPTLIERPPHPPPRGGTSQTEQTYYRWKKEYGGMDRDNLRRLKDLERENSRLKRLVADRRSTSRS